MTSFTSFLKQLYLSTQNPAGAWLRISLHYRTQYNCRKSITDVNFQYALQARFVSSMINAFHFYEQRRGLDPCKYLKMETTRALITANNCTSLISNRFINSPRRANSSIAKQLSELDPLSLSN